MPHIIAADIVIAAVLLLGVLIGARKGLIKSLSGVIIVVLAFLGAALVAQTLADPVAKWFAPLLEQQIQNKLTGQETADAGSLLASFHFSGESLRTLTDEVMRRVQETGVELLRAVTDSVAHSMAYAAVYLAAFLALLVVLWLLMKPVYLVVKLPGLRTVNALGGGALGLIWSALLVFLAVWLMQRFDLYLTEEMISRSFLLRFFAQNSPLSLITSL